MLSEDQFFEAKSFLLVYKDAHKCLEQAARKQGVFDKQKEFYAKVKEGQDGRELAFDNNGNLQMGANFRSNYFLRLGEFMRSNVNYKLENIPGSCDALSTYMTGIIDDLKKKIIATKSKP